MKGILGSFLFAGGLLSMFLLFQLKENIWLIIIAGIAIGFGLEMIIDDKVKTATESLREEFKK